jgi:hypothetical protein
MQQHSKMYIAKNLNYSKVHDSDDLRNLNYSKMYIAKNLNYSKVHYSDDLSNLNY